MAGAGGRARPLIGQDAIHGNASEAATNIVVREANREMLKQPARKAADTLHASEMLHT